MKLLPRYRRACAAREAQEWLLRLESDGETAHAAFDDWLMISAEHVEAVLLVTAFNEELARRLPGGQPVSVVATAGDVAAAAYRATTRRPRHARSALAAACTAVLVLCAALAIWHLLTTKTQPPATTAATRTVHFTSKHEPKTIDLSDGSTLKINNNTRVQVDMTTDRRQVQLHSGELQVDVHPDAQRPFEVTNACATVTAIGTSFSVRATQGAQCDLAVTRGTVRISPHSPNSRNSLNSLNSPHSSADSRATRDVTAGQVALIRQGAVVVRSLDAESLRQRLDWPHVSLRFHGASIDDVVTEFNRYNAVQLKMAEESVGQIHIWGNDVSPADVGKLLEILRQSGITATPPDEYGVITLARLKN